MARKLPEALQVENFKKILKAYNPDVDPQTIDFHAYVGDQETMAENRDALEDAYPGIIWSKEGYKRKTGERLTRPEIKDIEQRVEEQQEEKSKKKELFEELQAERERRKETQEQLEELQTDVKEEETTEATQDLTESGVLKDPDEIEALEEEERTDHIQDLKDINVFLVPLQFAYLAKKGDEVAWDYIKGQATQSVTKGEISKDEKEAFQKLLVWSKDDEFDPGEIADMILTRDDVNTIEAGLEELKETEDISEEVEDVKEKVEKEEYEEAEEEMEEAEQEIEKKTKKPEREPGVRETREKFEVTPTEEIPKEKARNISDLLKKIKNTQSRISSQADIAKNATKRIRESVRLPEELSEPMQKKKVIK